MNQPNINAERQSSVAAEQKMHMAQQKSDTLTLNKNDSAVNK
jgi:hypothetical protein